MEVPIKFVFGFDTSPSPSILIISWYRVRSSTYKFVWQLSGSIFFIHVYNPDSKTVGVKHKWNRMWKQCEDIIMHKTMIGYERGILERLSRSWLYERTLIYGLRNTCFYLHFTMSKLFWNHSCTIYASFFFFTSVACPFTQNDIFGGVFLFFLINDLRIEGVWCCTDCKAFWGKFVISDIGVYK